MRHQFVWAHLTESEKLEVDDLEDELYELLDLVADKMQLRLVMYRRGQMRLRRQAASYEP